ncbi:hypothetical protein TNIN_257831 [Trichonephila inaurata madagascariensis]|uniref:Uncharacterized protein n=1 Tax=Trichonephila inaurata madagascariensis TaxID=2747483 RepID=A0A8X6XY91_9ARAC|nr:hypothetical protein TNIN_257831 [Trichonephila inaurata madagascariensis]
MKRIQRGPMSPYALLKMIWKLKQMDNLAFFHVENESKSCLPALKLLLPQSLKPEISDQISVSVPVVYCTLNMPYSTVRQILWRTLHFYPPKSRLCTI